MTRATIVSALLVPFFTFETAFARLDYIDAAGVTEKGGAGYARMLPRTGADGKLDASLLPPEGAWALPPMPRLYFVDKYASAGGDGSVKAPFQTITEAAGAVPSGSALFLSPGNYSGEVTLTAGRTLSLVGCGFLTRLSDVTVTVEGDSSSTVLALANLSAATLTINGGSTYVRAYNANISTLSGSATGVKIRRYDMGTCIGNLYLVPLENTYNGYDTVTYASYLKGTSSSKHLHMVGDRPTVGVETCAFMSDVEAVTNGFGATISALHDADAALGALIDAETDAREEDDTALARAIRDSAASSTNYTDALRTYWGTQLSTLHGDIVSAKGTVSALDTREAGHYANLLARLDDMPSSGSISELKTELLGEIETQVGNLSDNVPDLSRPTAQGEIEKATPTIVASAVAEAKTEAQDLIAPVSTRVGTLETWKGVADGRLTSLKDAVNAIINALKKVKAGQALTDDDIPDHVEW